ncbi:chorismate mutase [Alkalicella caledoniensis]|uniref:chorismate mutase n=1 Tax=Alkalicella caledoniensis TaxID=2731377 RepID=A0A7G9W4C8_ALKCA|nr:chorismate mutase [Alkalicella caledoniensis]QNO13540.1 chorismate mutase [Alkalicella caledoniensis]
MIAAIRGAITIEANNEEDIKLATIELVDTIYKENNLVSEEIISLIFSVTKDITAANPAKFFRENFATDIPLFCVQEAEMEKAIPLCIRVIIHCEKTKKQTKHIYLRRAMELRPDLK